jgi:hypothetical protein
MALKGFFMRKRYPSDISREQFKKIEPLLSGERKKRVYVEWFI